MKRFLAAVVFLLAFAAVQAATVTWDNGCPYVYQVQAGNGMIMATGTYSLGTGDRLEKQPFKMIVTDENGVQEFEYMGYSPQYGTFQGYMPYVPAGVYSVKVSMDWSHFPGGVVHTYTTTEIVEVY